MLTSSRHRIRVLVAGALLLLPFVLGAQAPRPGPVALRADLARMVNVIDSVHPWPWRRVTSDSFHGAARRLATALPTMSIDRGVAAMMQLAASLGDGHTTLYPSGPVDFAWWFPIRLYRLSDAIVVTATDSSHADLLGARVLELGGRPAMLMADLVGTVRGADNAWGAHESTTWLSNARVMSALGLATRDTLQLRVVHRAGDTATVRLASQHTIWDDPSWMQRGEMFGPPGITMLNVFGLRAPLDFRLGDPALPLHLRNRIPIWFTWLAADSVLYVQSNFVQDFQGTQFAAVVDSVFAAADTLPVRRLVLDLRYNSGGDGSLITAFVHDIIRRPTLDQPGRLVVLTGPKTFSAAVLWLSMLREHAHPVSIGEPTGAPRNHAGDAGTVRLPKTGLELQLSTLRHYGTRSDETARAELPDFPVPMTLVDYFAGNDPALALARSHDDLRPLPSVAEAEGPSAVGTELARRQQRFSSVAGWAPFDERTMNDVAYRMLRGGRIPDAVELFRMNTTTFPGSANVWDSYGEALLAQGDTTAAVASYRRAAALDPGNGNARAIIAAWGGRSR